MGHQIIWTATAEQQFDELSSYLAEFWSPEIAIRFVNDFYEKLDLIAAMPYIGVASPQDIHFRKILITSKNLLFYRILEDTIALIAVLDTRQNPDKLPF
jgi:plasmid stabilization system protein ParE